MGKKWKLGNTESGYTVGNQKGNKLKVHVPKLFPLSKMPDKPLEENVSRSGSCFINDDDCKPGYGGSVTVQNYVEVPLTSTAKDIKSVNSESSFSGEIPHKTKVEIQVQNNDVDRLKDRKSVV